MLPVLWSLSPVVSAPPSDFVILSWVCCRTQAGLMTGDLECLFSAYTLRCSPQARGGSLSSRAFLLDWSPQTFPRGLNAGPSSKELNNHTFPTGKDREFCHRIGHPRGPGMFTSCLSNGYLLYEVRTYSHLSQLQATRTR